MGDNSNPLKDSTTQEEPSYNQLKTNKELKKRQNGCTASVKNRKTEYTITSKQ
jgi:hypothetical protein